VDSVDSVTFPPRFTLRVTTTDPVLTFVPPPPPVDLFP